MRRHLAVTAAAITAVLALAACEAEVTDTPDKPAATSDEKPSKDTGSDAEPAEDKETVAKVGDAITLTGFEDEKIAVTVVKTADPAQSKDEFFAPEPGNRWIGVQFQLTNTGKKAYQDSPTNGMQVADEQGQMFQSTFADITAGPSLSADVRLAPGAKALGWVVFDVPKDIKIEQVQVALNSGMADQTGQWQLK
ncbi:DUF4352 domain-containing protein [Streptomyces sp. STCH 565 A]|uniref:DUF4352 domain-containing protein n=1 Tax=Streptomyces sp. STCH 565 A TaxID=2950532 RepID=UPI0020759030|nr:DUF4352 domain-containing protein [Streptomyces sp. STCH 565 A]MCM8548899.1 DUF4352 domain-containing protein [Streptomyces sp. STCH 565 A]